MNQRFETQLQKKYLRTIEVPFKREVKVPTTSYAVEAYQHSLRVPVKKMLPVQTFEMVDEHYTEYEDRQAVREKEVWVKTIVPETYIERVPVPKTRQVAKPVTKYEEVEDYEEVQVTSEKAVPVQGYRVDQVEDTKVVEVEEVQDYELMPVPKGGIRPSGIAFEVGEGGPGHVARKTGHTVHHPSHPRVQPVPHDPSPNSPPTAYGWRPAWGGSSRLPAGAAAAPVTTSRPSSGSAPRLWNPYVPTSATYGSRPSYNSQSLRRF